MFCNENDRPYLLEAPPVHVAALARIVGELAPEDCPFGVDYLWDARAALGVAVAAAPPSCARCCPGVYESDMGLWEPDAAALLRERRAYGADDLCVLMNVTPEFASPLGDRSPACARARPSSRRWPTRSSCRAPMAGAEPDARRRARGRRSGRRERARPAQHRRDGRPTSPRSRRSSAASSSAATSSATATPGARSSASACGASWTRRASA